MLRNRLQRRHGKPRDEAALAELAPDLHHLVAEAVPA
jgi:hypothetical protein